MVLSGRSDVSIEEIAASLPDELRRHGDATAVAERLVSAPLLRPAGERRYGFVHRIFGEALAAEELLDLDPEDSGVLDVAAPVVTQRIRGLRADWLVPMTLVAATSERWRRALAERDPLAAARAIPSDAPLEERLQAARLIWQLYVEWRIWISDYRRMSIVEDESVLARLLGTGGLDELHAEIRAAISSGSRETIGNAIKVLATLGDRTIESQLRHILESSEDYVLRRTAAIAARDLRMDALFYLIAHRALQPAEDTEAQDMTYAALDLATHNDLVPLALRAARKGGTAIGILAHAIQGRISARDELKVLRAVAEVFVYDASALLETLEELADEDSVSGDFGEALIPRLVEQGRARAHPLEGYWRDVGTIESYWGSHMDLLEPEPRFVLDDPAWPILTLGVQRPPARIESSARIDASLISAGAVVCGTVEHCILSPGVVVEEGAVVRDSVLFHDTRVSRGAQIDRVLVDELVCVEAGASVGASDGELTVIGRGVRVATGARVGAGASLEAASR